MNLTSYFVTILNFISTNFGSNIGLSIILITLLIRVLFLPIILPSMKSLKKMQSLAPEISKLKKQYGKDKETFAKKQMELYQKNGVNPMSGCLPQLIQVAMFIVFYQVLVSSLKNGSVLVGSSYFLGIDITNPDKSYVLPVLTGLTQFVLGIMLIPATSTEAEVKMSEKTVTANDDKDTVDMEGMAKTMQTQMVFVMPLVTAFAALRFPAGLALYWVTSTLFSIIQQYFVSGPGGLKVYAQKYGIIKE